MSRGGKSVHFFQKTKVTHMVAMNLPYSKIVSLLKTGGGVGSGGTGNSGALKVVHPNWVLDW